MARKFRFRLATVERLRRESRDVQRRVVAEHQRTVSQLEARLTVVANRLQNNKAELRSTLVGRPGEVLLNVEAIRHQETHHAYLCEDLARRHDELAQRRSFLEAEQNRLAEATKRLKVIEKLRNRRWKEHLAGARREEQAQSDEAALNLLRYGLGPGRREHVGL